MNKELIFHASTIVANGILCVFGILYTSLGILKLHGLIFPEDTMREYLRLSNPVIFFLANRTVLGFAALVEILVGMFVLRKGETVFARSGFLLWVTLAATAYRSALAHVHYNGPCGCLLGINRFLPISAKTQRSVADIILVATIVVAMVMLIYARIITARERK